MPTIASASKKLTIHDNGYIESELAEPYDILLNPTLRAHAQAAIHVGEAAAPQEQSVEQDWKDWETSFNDNTRKAVRLAGVGRPRRPRGRQGLNNEILVDCAAGGGFGIRVGATIGR